MNAVAKGGNAVGKVAGGMAALSKAAEPMAQWRNKGSLGANALSFADAFGGKMMSMAKQGVKAGKNAALYRNPVYQGYQSAVSAMGSKNGLLGETPNGNAEGVTASDNLANLHRPQFLVKGQTASQKIGSAVNEIGDKLNEVENKVGDFFTPPTNASNDMSQKATSRASTPTPNASSSMTGAMQGGTTSQNSTQAQRQNVSGVTPRTTPNMILHNLMNAENSQSSQFEGRRPYEPRGAEQGNSGANTSAGSQNMSNLQNMPSANLNNSSASEGMRQGSSLAQVNTATSSAQNMSDLNSTPSQITSLSTGSNSAVGTMGQNASSAPVNQANSVNPATPENTAQRSRRNGE